MLNLSSPMPKSGPMQNLAYQTLLDNNIITKHKCCKNDLLEPSMIKKSNSHSDPLFKESGILKLSDLYQIEVMTFMHDFANEKWPVSFKDVYKMNCNIHGIYETRQAHLLHIPRTKSRFVYIMFIPRVVVSGEPLLTYVVMLQY